MEQYRFDPYTGRPLNRRPGSSRAWLGNGYSPGGQAQTPAQTQSGQPSGVIFRPVASYDGAKAVPTDFSGALTIMPDLAHGGCRCI